MDWLPPAYRWGVVSVQFWLDPVLILKYAPMGAAPAAAAAECAFDRLGLLQTGPLRRDRRPGRLLVFALADRGGGLQRRWDPLGVGGVAGRADGEPAGSARRIGGGRAAGGAPDRGARAPGGGRQPAAQA